MKKFLISLISVLVILPLTVQAKNDKVKVYVYEAGGCPYCEAQIEYLKGLDSYNKKFKIIEKELYIDHEDWEEGADFEEGKKVAEEFLNAGFTDASYQGTPFVVISDTYAAAAYNADLESIIDAAYEEGDKDAVKCITDGKDNCIRSEKETKVANANTWLIIACTLVLIAVYVVKSNCDRNTILKALKNNEEPEALELVDQEKQIEEETKTIKKENNKNKKK